MLFQDVDEDHIKNTTCTDPIDHQEHPIHQVFSATRCSRSEVSQSGYLFQPIIIYRYTGGDGKTEPLCVKVTQSSVCKSYRL